MVLSIGVIILKFMLGRELRTRVDLLRTNIRSVVEKKQFEQTKNINGQRKCSLAVGERVFVNDPRKASKRSEAVVERQYSLNTYTVRFNDGYVAKKHPNRIVKTRLIEYLKKGGGTEVSVERGENPGSASGNFVPRRSTRLA